MTGQRCVLLINLGSPDRPDKKAIRTYLREFLLDPRVMDIPALIRWMIVHLVILPFRPGSILEKYQKIWDGERFLLKRHGEELKESLGKKLGKSYTVRLAMRYGNPSIKEVMNEIHRERVSELIIVPLFPQYASATSGSVLEKVFEELRSWLVYPGIRLVSRFFDDPEFIEAWRLVSEPYLGKKPDHVLFSFHGLPESHVLKADYSGRCLDSHDCCSRLTQENQHCYRAQCYQTALKISEASGISDTDYSVAFQSRMGKARWIEPATSELISELALSGVKKLLVFCPSFVADCLETVEEIGEEESARFKAYGGQELLLVPSLNSHPVWVEALAKLIATSR